MKQQLGGYFEVANTIFMFLVMAALLVLSLTWLFVAFFGGTMPVLGIERDASIMFGLFWLIIVEPLALTVLYWISMLICVPVAMALLTLQRIVRA